uniref:Uncharacterized protein n=1 Tax=Anguilla anguilla TaxID=7936 RepID=A0A0E9PB30_ANGAN
MEKKKGKISL